MGEAAIGDIVKAHYHSGTYIGTVREDRGANYLIEVLAVLKHPLQGDLHNYGKLEGVFFHERKALAFHEKMNVKKAAVHPFDGEVPAYGASLQQAVEDYRKKLGTDESEFNRQSLLKLNNLEENHYKKLY
ncbi:sporulation phosphorelay system protein KapB [Oceanobacillus damuensis]|uniref:sporulation phosphorelay system protein KapB n=1 Tax=Oceanobacillus damuensis TaxID=937928 RepID=UPI00082BDA57|nr:sporulation phosphorelay system protein KapB [Oceanobacillus damuensis]